MSMQRRIAVATVVLAGGVLTACSSGGSTASPGGTSSGTPSPSAATSTAPPASVPDPNATEKNPPGDIPDDQVFVSYRLPGSSFSVKVPEGWSRSKQGAAVVFTDKYNSVRIEAVSTTSAPTVASARSTEVPQIAAAAPAYKAGTVTVVRRQPGHGVLVTYLQDSEPNPVTDKVVRDAVERYEFWHNGEEAVLTLTGPKGADNVDPWRTVSDSLRWH
jgi:hypothetical protein